MTWFVSHFNATNQIPIVEANESLTIFSVVLFLFAIVSIKKYSIAGISQFNKDFIKYESTETLKGVAILLLFIGHLSIKCVKNASALEYAGMWAVIIFLFTSGIGLVKSYNLTLQKKGFLRKRLLKLVVPVWVTIILFYLLDYLLLDKKYPFYDILLNCLGLFSFIGPNPALWFITYIIYQYFLFFIISKLKTSISLKIIILYLISFCVGISVSIIPFLRNHFGMWSQYTIVFPIAVTIGYFRFPIKKYLSNVFGWSPILFSLIIIMAFLLFYFNPGWETLRISNFPFSEFEKLLTLFRPFYLIVCLVGIVYCIDIFSKRSRFLVLLGKYSFEIYLLHMPFMVSYDLLLFRKPLYLFLLIYLIFILTLGFCLSKITNTANQIFIKSNKALPG